MRVKAKKHLGQHFLRNNNIAKDIANALVDLENVLEIGPGTGVLTTFLQERNIHNLKLIELDQESVLYLANNFPKLDGRVVFGDFLKLPLDTYFGTPFSIIGNFPYNISSQIFFKILESELEVNEVVCMLQKEVARRIASPPGSKEYGILSVLLQTYYEIDYLFDVGPEEFDPPPKVISGVIQLKRNTVSDIGMPQKHYFKVVKQGFNNRRKTLRNALKVLNLPPEIVALPILNKRAEQLSVEDFKALALQIYKTS